MNKNLKKEVLFELSPVQEQKQEHDNEKDNRKVSFRDQVDEESDDEDSLGGEREPQISECKSDDSSEVARKTGVQRRSLRSRNVEAMRSMKGVSMRGQNVFVRPKKEMSAMAWDERAKAKAKTFWKERKRMLQRLRGGKGGSARNVLVGGNKRNEDDSNSNSPVVLEDTTLQYRLEATRKYQTRSYFKFFLTCGFCESKGTGDGTIGENWNQSLATMLHWMFRVNFLFLFSVMCIMFFVNVIIFGAFITIAGVLDDECVVVGGDSKFGSVGADFADAFALSWTTFSTVGYGSTYPSSSTNCFFITFICSLESLLGVLYSGFCGAILFGKVLRIQSHAQVIFSDPIVIRYGDGVKEDHTNDIEALIGGYSTLMGSPNGAGGNTPKTPCPVLEFRIINRMYDEQGGEIMDATLNVVANIDANDAEPPEIEGSDGDKNNNSGSGLDGSQMSQDTSLLNDYSSGGNRATERSEDSNASHFRRKRSIRSTLHNIIGKFENDEGGSTPGAPQGSAKAVSKKIFSKLIIEAGEHPFFKRIWVARHTLDDSSPILKPRVRRQIRKNQGSWPNSLSTYEAVRESLQFNQILVSLNGVSNVSASDVYAQKIYDFVDINVGYQFVNILYRDNEGSLKVDTDLLNDVIEQRGGGGEPLIVDE